MLTVQKLDLVFLNQIQIQLLLRRLLAAFHLHLHYITPKNTFAQFAVIQQQFIPRPLHVQNLALRILSPLFGDRLTFLVNVLGL